MVQLPKKMFQFNNRKFVIGVDEVGRGPLAGPVVVASILVDESILNMNVKDSKLLSKPVRNKLFEQLVANYKYCLAVVEPNVIDKINILNATKKAMIMAISELRQYGDYDAYVDGNFKPIDEPNTFCVIKGDLLLKPISAASIIAKVFRDELMTKLADQHPEYHWHKNSGYGTPAHIQAIRELGPTIYHRKNFIKNFI